MGQDCRRPVPVCRPVDPVGDIDIIAAESLFHNRIQGQMEKGGMEQGQDKLDFNRVLAWMATLVQWGRIQSNKMCWVFVTFVTLSASNEENLARGCAVCHSALTS
jgi:hypothetical protein